MPLPVPKEGEAQNEFISRCLSSDGVKQEFGSGSEQAKAVCFNQWSKKDKKMVNVFTPITKGWTETVKSGDGDVAKRFFEVVISGINEDRDGEVMDKAAVEDMISQFQSGRIPLFPDHGIDPQTGERTYSWKQIMGVWTDAKMDGNNLKAVARLNNAHPDADLFWGYLQEGMPVGFSIGAKPVEIKEEEIDDASEL